MFIALDGEHAVDLAKRIQPDLVLLDALMPGIDGFETCRRLKAERVTRKIPVIFMLALDDAVDKAEGFAQGGADYVNKPIDEEEMLMRIRTQLALSQLRGQSSSAEAEVRYLGHLLQTASGFLGELGDTLTMPGGVEDDPRVREHRLRELGLQARFIQAQVVPFAKAALTDGSAAYPGSSLIRPQGQGWGSSDWQ